MKRLRFILFVIVMLSLITLSAKNPTMEHQIFLPLVVKEYSVPTCWVENNSYFTTCEEGDNVNVPIFAQEISHFQVIATHPTYNVGVDDCDPDFSGCDSGFNIKAAQTDPDPCFDDPNNKIYDDHINNAIWACPEPEWWRPFSMNVLVGGEQRNVHRLVWIRKIDGVNEWPQILVLYEDGNMRLKPHPPMGSSDTCLGSSVIIGPAVPSSRPYVAIQEVSVDPSAFTLDLAYRDGGTAHISLLVDRIRIVAEVDVSYPASDIIPFATFRSMYVSNGNADVDHIRNPLGVFPIMTGWVTLEGPWWFFHRTVRSTHNISAPDIRIEVLN